LRDREARQAQRRPLEDRRGVREPHVLERVAVERARGLAELPADLDGGTDRPDAEGGAPLVLPEGGAQGVVAPAEDPGLAVQERGALLQVAAAHLQADVAAA